MLCVWGGGGGQGSGKTNQVCVLYKVIRMINGPFFHLGGSSFILKTLFDTYLWRDMYSVHYF